MAAPKGNKYTALRKVSPTYTDKEIEDIIAGLLKWADEDDGLFLVSFTYTKYKKSEAWLRDLAKYHPEMEVALALAKLLIAAKITRHCWIGDRNSTFGEKILPMYSEEYKELIKWKAQVNNLGMNDPKNLAALQTYLDNINEKKVKE